MNTAFPIEFYCPPPIGKTTFSNLEEINSFLNREYDFWTFLNNLNPGTNRLNDIRVRILNKLSSLVRLVSQLIEHKDQQLLFDRHLNDFRGEFAEFYYVRPHLVSYSPEAIFIKNLLLENVSLGISALGASWPVPIDVGDPTSLEGAVILYLFRQNGHINNLESFKTSLQSVINENRDLFETNKLDLQAANQKFNDWQNDATNKLVEYETLFSNLQVTLRENFTAIEETYDKKLALHASVSYWDKKRKRHVIMAKRFGSSGIIALLVVGSIVISQIYEFKRHQVTFENSNFALIATFAVLIFLGIWVIRILVQMFLSHVHLENDAQERLTMIKTYLALLRYDHGPDKSQRELILQTLFRPSPTGIIKDDMAPPFLWDWILKSKKID